MVGLLGSLRLAKRGVHIPESFQRVRHLDMVRAEHRHREFGRSFELSFRRSILAHLGCDLGKVDKRKRDLGMETTEHLLIDRVDPREERSSFPEFPLGGVNPGNIHKYRHGLRMVQPQCSFPNSQRSPVHVL